MQNTGLYAPIRHIEPKMEKLLNSLVR